MIANTLPILSAHQIPDLRMNPTPDPHMNRTLVLVNILKACSRRIPGRHSPANPNYSGPSTATTSVSSSVFCFTYANGRRYQSDRFNRADYLLPNDDIEQDRLDLIHHMFLLLLGGKLYTAPLENPQKVLDVGTGTGIWAIDFAE